MTTLDPTPATPEDPPASPSAPTAHNRRWRLPTIHQDWDPAEGHPHRGRVLAIACLSLVLVVVAVASLNVAIPTLVTDLQPTSSQLLWIIDSYALVFAGLLLVAGAIGDRFGRKGALLGGLVVFGLGAIAASFTSSPDGLIVTRAVMGAGAAFVMPATLSIITSVYPPAERPKAIATWAGFAGAGSALGPILSGLVLTRWNWNAVFLINVPTVLITLVLVVLFVPTSRDTRQRRLDLLGAALSVVALGSLLWGIIEGPEKGWTSTGVLGAFAVALLSGMAFVWWELRSDQPMLDPRFFRIPQFRAGSLVITALFFAMFGMFLIMTQYLQYVRGYSPLLAGVATLPFAATMVIVAPRSPRLVGRFGARTVTTAGILSVAAGFLVFSQLEHHSPYLMIVAGMVLVAGGMGASTAPASTAIVSALPLDKAGVASAVNDTTREVGGSLGIAILGTLLTAGYTSLMRSDLPEAMPTEARDLASESIGAALAVAERAPAGVGGQLAELARTSFVSASSTTFLVAAGFLLVLAVVANRAVPADLEVTGAH